MKSSPSHTGLLLGSAAWLLCSSTLPAQGQDRDDPNMRYDERPTINTRTERAVHGNGRTFPKLLDDAAINRLREGTPEDDEDAQVPTDPNAPPPLPPPPPAQPPSPIGGSGPGITADSDFVYFRNIGLPDSATGNPGVWPPEPSVAAMGRTVLYCGNTYASLSQDAGLNWTYIDPNTEFPSGVCCDQVLYYDRTRNLTIWLMQGTTSGNENIYRIAVANSQANLASRNWYWYDLDPQDYGFPAGTWWDFPEMTCSSNYMWFTTNGQSGSNNAIMVKVDLDDLADAGSTTFSSAQLINRQIRLIQGAQTVMYGAGHVDNDTLFIYRWPETGSITGVSRDIAAWDNGASTAPGPDGLDWFSDVERASHKVRGASATASTLYFFWTASQGGSFPYPHLRAAMISRNDSRTYQGTEVMWSSSFAIAYGSAAANDRGHLAGTVTWGGGAFYPSTAAFVADDYNNVDLTPLEWYTIANGTDGPSTRRWGDYISTRRHSPHGNTWVGTAFSQQGGSARTDAVNTYTWMGRERDRPPPSNTIYVDLNNGNTREDGSSTYPFKTVTAGHIAAMDGDALIVSAGNYTENPTLDKDVTVDAEGGTVNIGN